MSADPVDQPVGRDEGSAGFAGAKCRRLRRDSAGESVPVSLKPERSCDAAREGRDVRNEEPCFFPEPGKASSSAIRESIGARVFQ